MERSADRALYLPSGDWRVLKRAWRHGTGEIKATLYMVDAVREGQGHAGSTPATSTIYDSIAQKRNRGRTSYLPRFSITSPTPFK